jgi:pimeloyl-ACP methyl ester carboxylesterase
LGTKGGVVTTCDAVVRLSTREAEQEESVGDCSVVFLHGAGVGPWVWERVQSRLSAPSIALEVPGRVAGVTPERCVELLAAEIDALDAGELILVAHSMSGVLVPGLAAWLGSRLMHVVYVSAVIPEDNQSFLAAIGFPMGLLMRVLFLVNPAGLRPSDSMIRSGLCNDLDEKDTAEVIARYAPEFPGLYVSPVAGPAAIPSTYVRLTRDGSVSPTAQAKMVARLERPSVVEFDAGHLVMLSKPDELAQVVQTAASA